MEKHNPNRLLLLIGNDELAIARRMEELRREVDPQGMNSSRLAGGSASEDEINTAVNAIPFLGDRRLVSLADPSALAEKPDKKKKFLAFLQATPETTLLVLHEPVDPRNAGKHWLVQAAGKLGMQVEQHFLPKPNEVTAWIRAEVKRQGGSIDGPAAARLAEMSAGNPRLASQEIAKLLAHNNYQGTISLADVEQVCALSPQADIFKLVDAIGGGETREALTMLERLLENEEARYVFSMIVRQFRLLILAREWLDSGGRVDQAAQALNLHPYVAEKVCGQAHGFNMPLLEDIHQHLLLIDEADKSSDTPLALSLETFIVSLQPGR